MVRYFFLLLILTSTAFGQISKPTNYYAVASTSFIDAYNYGILPSASASDNTTKLNSLLNGGNKTVVITQPGTYDINNTIYLYSNTELILSKGVTLRKVASFGFVFLNVGALTGITDSNIMLKGVCISVNGNELLPNDTAKTYGLRGHLSLFRVKNATITDFVIDDLGTAQWAIHVCTFEQLNIQLVKVRGNKDGIHLGRGTGFVIRDVECETYDDALALNAQDYPSCNPELGDIKNGLIENYVDKYQPSTAAYTIRGLLGRWTDWSNGMSVSYGQAVVNSGKVYRVINGNASTVTSTTAPTFSSGAQTLADGVRWRMVQSDTTRSANLLNLTFRNIRSYKDRQLFGMTYDGRTASNCGITPEIDTLNYPSAYNIVFDGLYSLYNGRTTHFISQAKWVKYNVTIRNFAHYGVASTNRLVWNGDLSDSGQAVFENCNFKGLTGTYNFYIGGRVRIRFANNLYDDNINIIFANQSPLLKPSVISLDRISTNSGLAPIKGDIVNVAGVLYAWKGSWVILNP